ncbi:PKD domain-containing protein [Hymenobacter sp. 15J16-1T3B]|uniref:PKD domain-containing protein n=1 Tax=Hymenobacter sp. 15J16-1T3B TaxID=2886941 RepID=UPI001D114840|nr:PKD domain-containing protein [Hymenobacter sp. 15J16-1T3B]MCC3158555.1 PKD domain-containing protein [Hymenobacter sp. 15J16-1T3B]
MHFDTLFPLRRPALTGSAALLLTGALLLGGCQDKDPDGLDGPVPTATFSSQLNTTQYPVEVTFTSSSQDGFLEQWNFGDNSPLETHTAGEVVKHTYTRAGAYQVKLTAAGRGGTAISPAQTVTIPSLCGDATFNALTACSGTGAASWRLSDQPGAIKRLSASGAVISSSAAPLPVCQGDDQFSFANTFAYSYDAGAGTYSAGTCGAPRTANSGFVYKAGSGSVLGQIILKGKGAFIGPADSVVNKTYDIVEASASRLRLQGTNPDGTKTEVTLLPQLSALDIVKQKLTGGSSRTWVLDNTQAAAIIVGPDDANPGQWYGGGPAGSLPPCQADDEFTFSTANVYTYDAKTQTLVAGGVGCSAPLSGTSNFLFGPATGAGVAQFELSRTGAFIGVTDAPDLVYRIISITDQTMVLRAGRPTAGTVFTMKLRVK